MKVLEKQAGAVTDEDEQTGPHHKIPEQKKMIAVALEQRRARNDVSGTAPKVTAAGRGHIAEQILEIAFSQGIKVREDADLAELLSAVELEDDIPLEAFAAVAEILIYLYRANGDTSLELETPGTIARAWAEYGSTNPAYVGAQANGESGNEGTHQ